MKVATIGTGFIVDWFLNAVKQNEGISCVAMYSRNVEHAKNLKEKYEVEKVYNCTYAKLFKNQRTDFSFRYHTYGTMQFLTIFQPLW